jgi:hypothetical protein
MHHACRENTQFFPAATAAIKGKTEHNATTTLADCWQNILYPNTTHNTRNKNNITYRYNNYYLSTPPPPGCVLRGARGRLVH